MTWENAAGGLPDSPVNALAESPHIEGLLFAGLDVGAFYSEDGGASWALLGTGLPAVAVYDLKIEPESNMLIAGTHGRSMYTYPIGDAPTDIQTIPRIDDIELSVYPNPFSNYTTLEFTLPEPAESRGSVFDLQGRRIRALGSTETRVRQIRYVWDGKTDSGAKASSGAYIIQVEVRSGESTVKRSALVARTN
jgi:hypothetical protein